MPDATENSPLLADEPQLENSNAESTTTTTLPASHYFKRPIKILTIIGIFIAISELVLSTATQMVASTTQFSTWTWDQQFPTIAALTVASFVFALINLRFAFPIGLNVLVDIILGLNLAEWFGNIISDGFPGEDSCKDYYYHKPESPACLHQILVIKILVAICVSLGAILALLHVILLVLRVVACFKARFWERQFALYFPTGEITLSFTVRVLKQQPVITQSSTPETAVQETVSENHA